MARQKLYLNTTKEFKSEHGHVVITRGDFEGLPCGMIAIEFSDEQMQKLVDDINLTLKRDYSKEELALLRDYENLGNENGLTQEQIYLAEELSDQEFKITEDTALDMGMEYYEDLTEESYQSICRATKANKEYYDKVIK